MCLGIIEPLSLRLLDGFAVPTDRLHCDSSEASAAARAEKRLHLMPTSLDNGQRSLKKLLASVVRRVVSALKGR